MKARGSRLYLLSCIVDFGKGSKLLRMAKKLGGVGETVLLGKGTIRSEWLNKLGVFERRKEIFVAIVNEVTEADFYDRLVAELGLNKPNHGIAFSIPLKYAAGFNDARNPLDSDQRDVKNVEYESIFIIVNKDSLEEVLESAESAGSTGGTIIHGRGSAKEEKMKLFGLEIEPEKAIILILSKIEKTDSIVSAIKSRLNIEQPGAGIIFVMDVSRTLGLYEG